MQGNTHTYSHTPLPLRAHMAFPPPLFIKNLHIPHRVSSSFVFVICTYFPCFSPFPTHLQHLLITHISFVCFFPLSYPYRTSHPRPYTNDKHIKHLQDIRIFSSFIPFAPTPAHTAAAHTHIHTRPSASHPLTKHGHFLVWLLNIFDALFWFLKSPPLV